MHKLTNVQNEPKTITTPSNMFKLFTKKDWIKYMLASGMYAIKCRISKMRPTSNCSGWMTEVGYLVLHQFCVTVLICLWLYNVFQWWAKRKAAQPFILFKKNHRGWGYTCGFLEILILPPWLPKQHRFYIVKTSFQSTSFYLSEINFIEYDSRSSGFWTRPRMML